jgi:hypothetical protein
MWLLSASAKVTKTSWITASVIPGEIGRDRISAAISAVIASSASVGGME